MVVRVAESILFMECPKCKEQLRFNPFIAGGEDY